MSTTFLKDVGFLLSGYAVLYFSFSGWGKMIGHIASIHVSDHEDTMVLFWLGFTAVVIIGMIWHIFFPVQAGFSLIVIVSGLVFYFKQIAQKQMKTGCALQSFFVIKKFQDVLFLFGFILILFWLLFQSMRPPLVYDSGLYHLCSIRWINEYPIVPGLVNLHSRFAFNSTFFIYVAICNFYHFGGGNNALGPSFLFLMSLLGFLNCLKPLMKNKRIVLCSDYYSLFIVPIILFYSYVTSSPSPDTVILLIQIVLMLQLIKLTESSSYQSSRLNFIIISSAVSVTCKLSNVVFAFFVCMVGFVICMVRTKKNSFSFKGLLPSIALSAVILIVWSIRGIILSGYPLFPSTVFQFDTPWTIPTQSVENTANWIYSWAKDSNRPPSEVLGNWKWFFPWFKRMSHYELVWFPMTIFFGALLAVILQIITKTKKEAINQRNKFLPFYIGILPLFCGIVFWFFTAPDPRFLGAILWILSIITLTLAIRLIGTRKIQVYCTGMFCFVYLVPFGAMLNHYKTDIAEDFKRIQTQGILPAPQPELIKKMTYSGLCVYSPRKGDQCWDSQLPCAPFINSDLYLLGRTMAKGFSVKKEGKDSEK